MGSMTEGKYSDQAIARARNGALEWLQAEADAYPRSWKQEAADDARRGYVHYEEDFEAPPIAGYEALERDGQVERVGPVMRGDQERIHFRRRHAT